MSLHILQFSLFLVCAEGCRSCLDVFAAWDVPLGSSGVEGPITVGTWD